MKKLYVFSALILVFAFSFSAFGNPESAALEKCKPNANYTDEMKFDDKADISEEDGADSVERSGDHAGSPYFTQLDFYNMESTDTLTILQHFKTIQQSSEWSCGVAAAEMVINYFGLLDNHTERTLAEFRPQKLEPGPTDLRQELQILQKTGGMNVESTLDVKEDGKPIQETFHLSNIRDYLKRNMPVLVCWNDWGGHWQVIIGYDTMGTEIENDDVIIVADPYDTTDHNQDGYGVYPAMRFIYNFTMYNYFGDNPEDNDMLFIAVAKS